MLKSLRSFLYPNVKYEVVINQYEGQHYLLIVVQRQTGGPFMVSEKAEKDKKINLKAGRYVRIESETRLARVDEEYDLLRKFSNYHYSSISTTDATIGDLNLDLLQEYLQKASSRRTSSELSKFEIAKQLQLLDKNDPTENRVNNYAVLMFSTTPEKFIPYSYTEMIIDMFGTKRKMESKVFTGSVWKQYHSVLNYINDNFINELTIREDGKAENRKVANFPFTALEELLANAIVHNNYENGKAIQVYISETQINIINYNKPLPPLQIKDLNERSLFNERDTENPELRDMFKSLGIIESFGTGIGEAKRAMKENGSPELYYKYFDINSNITSVVIPVNEEYLDIKNGPNQRKNLWIGNETKEIKQKIWDSDFSETTKKNMIHLYNKIGTEIFGNTSVIKILDCSEVTATAYIKRLLELNLIGSVSGLGKGKYRFK